MNDLILRTRVDAFHDSIERIRELVQSLKQRKRQIGEMEAHLTASLDRMRAVENSLILVERSVEDTRLPAPADVRTAMDAARESLRELVAMREIVRAMQQTVFFSIIRGEGKIAEALKDNAERRRENYAKALGDIRRLLNDRLPASRRQAWESYQKNVRTPVQNLFAEYVEFIGGLAVRDVGLDEGVCQLADELMRTYSFMPSRGDWMLLSVPARQKAVNMTLAQTIRLGFPEWTIWALPFAAHEFWYVVARSELGTAERLRELPVEDPRTQECLADAFGTYAMGPAYAYAAMLLRLDPFSAYLDEEDHAAHDNRAHAILTMLRLLDEKKGGAARPYHSILTELQEEWTGALELACPAGEPRVAEKRWLEEAIRKLFDLLWDKAASSFGLDSPFRNSIEWAKALLENRIPEVGAEAELRWVLNAAWLARVQIARDQTRTDDDRLAETKRIKECATELWKRVAAKSSSPGDQRPPSRAPQAPRAPLPSLGRV